MQKFLKVMLWNANGLLKHQQELEVILESEKIDVCLIAETHFTKQSFIKIKNYVIYHTIHPNNSARGGSAVIIKNSIKHFEEEKYCTAEFQATTITINNNLSLTAVYSPPRHQIKNDQYAELIRKHKNRFLMGGDFNAKHTHWGSRLTTTKGRELFKALLATGCNTISTRSPTYWPTDQQKTPDLIDFFIFKKISAAYLTIENGLDMSSDHSPIYLTINEKVTLRDPPFKLTNQYTDWEYFRKTLEDYEDCTSILNTTSLLEDEILNLTNTIQRAAWLSTPVASKISGGHKYTKEIKEMVLEKRKMRRRWHQTRSPADKKVLNKITKELSLKIKEYKNITLTKYLNQLTHERDTNYSLWKCTKKLKQPAMQCQPIKTTDNSWAKSNSQKAKVFSDYLADTFTPYGASIATDIDDVYTLDDETEIPPTTEAEICDEIKKMKPRKSPGYDLLTGEILKQLPQKIITKLTTIINATFKLQYVSIYWKIAEVIMFNKPGKEANDVTSYRPISLLPILSKLMEKLLIRRMNNVIETRKLIPNHQFGFRTKHSTIDQVHRITRVIENAFEDKKICSAVFLDVSKAFDKVCHTGLLCKIRALLPKHYYHILKSYLSDRFFRVKQEDDYSDLKPIKAGVPQGSVLGPILYLLFTYDLPNNQNCVTATFADDTAILSVGTTILESTTQLQQTLNEIYNWTMKWHIKLNETKSIHIDFTYNKISYLPLNLNGIQIPYSNNAKYLGMTLDSKLRWKVHVKKKKEELEIKYRNMYWLMGKQSVLSIHNKLILYKQILKPIWTYGIQLWGCSSMSNIMQIQRFQTKVLKCATNAPWYIRIKDLERDLNIDSIETTIKKFALSHEQRLSRHVNSEASVLIDSNQWQRRLKRKKPHDLHSY